MKKLLILFAFGVASTTTHAQWGGLAIQNGSPCDLTVTMYAEDACASDPCGDIISNAISVSGGGHVAYGTCDHFVSGPPGLASYTTLPCLVLTPGALEYDYLVINFTGCPPSWGCTPPALQLANPCFTPACAGGAASSGSSSCGGNTVNATFTSGCASGSAHKLDDMSLSIY